MRNVIIDTENDAVRETCVKYCRVLAERVDGGFLVLGVRDIAAWNRVLVTDDNATAAEFRTGGGEAIVVPCESNHLNGVDPVDWVLKNLL